MSHINSRSSTAAAVSVAAALVLSLAGCTEAQPADTVINNHYTVVDDACLECVVADVLESWLEENWPDGPEAGPTEPESDAGPAADPDDVESLDDVDQGGEDDVGPDVLVEPEIDDDPADTEDSPPDVGPEDVAEEDPLEPLEIELDFDSNVLSGLVLAAPEVTGGSVILGVEFFVGDVRIDTDFIPPYSFVINTAAFPDGPQTISVFTADTAGQTADDVKSVVFDNTPPVLTTTTPGDGEALFFEDGDLVMTATSEDINPLSVVRFRANGLLVGEFDDPPYEASISWEELFISEDALPKNLYLQFYAEDELGLSTEVTYNVSVHRRFFWEFSTFGEIWAEAIELPGGDLVFGNKDSRLISVTPQGSEQWDIALDGPIVNAPTWDPNHNRLLIGDLDGKLHAVTPTGGIAWTQDMGSPPGGVLRVVGSTAYMAAFSGQVLAINPSNGSTNWSVNLPDFIFSNPAVTSDGTVYIGCQDKNLYAVKNGSIVWSSPTGGVILSSPVVGTDGSIYVGSNDGWMYGFHADGSDKWDRDVGGELWGQPYIDADNNVYTLSISKFVTKLEPLDGEIQWQTKTQGLSYGGPVAGPDGTIYVGTTAGYIFAIHPESGDILWQMELSDTIHARPLITADKLFVGSVDRSLYGIHLTPP